ncbi:MAG: queuosine salvage family protein [Phycisphaerae bacterium]|nr:queuosine salvage family protein [Phycisphaerae bacterium]
MPDILNSCRRVVQRAQHVHIDDGSLRKSAAGIDRQAISIPTHPHPLQIRGSRQACANFVLLCDCLNFCFWSDTPWVVTFAGTDWTRTFAMLAGLVRAIQADADWLNPQRWADVREAEVSEIFAGTGQIPLLRERVEVLHETGAVLISKYDGSFLNLVEEAGGQAPAVAELLARDFSSFRDVADYDGEPVAFLKRAQICAADLTSHWSAQGYGSLGGLDDLTVFADYRLPQLFRHWGTMRVTDSLYHRIEALDEIPAGSPEEVELRAATICISDRLAELLSVPAWRLDYFLWERSHDPAVVVRHHRTRTVFY